MTDREIKNAIIKSATISNDDHGCLTAWLHLDYGGTGQGFGGYVLMLAEGYTNRSQSMRGPNYAGIFIGEILRIAEVSSWDKLPGKTIRADSDWGKVHGIGHIVKDRWFYPEKAFTELRNEASPTTEEGVTA